jgi:hypothetical protein
MNIIAPEVIALEQDTHAEERTRKCIIYYWFPDLRGHAWPIQPLLHNIAMESLIMIIDSDWGKAYGPVVRRFSGSRNALCASLVYALLIYPATQLRVVHR